MRSARAPPGTGRELRVGSDCPASNRRGPTNARRRCSRRRRPRRDCLGRHDRWHRHRSGRARPSRSGCACSTAVAGSWNRRRRDGQLERVAIAYGGCVAHGRRERRAGGTRRAAHAGRSEQSGDADRPAQSRSTGTAPAPRRSTRGRGSVHRRALRIVRSSHPELRGARSLASGGSRIGPHRRCRSRCPRLVGRGRERSGTRSAVARCCTSSRRGVACRASTGDRVRRVRGTAAWRCTDHRHSANSRSGTRGRRRRGARERARGARVEVGRARRPRPAARRGCRGARRRRLSGRNHRSGWTRSGIGLSSEHCDRRRASPSRACGGAGRRDATPERGARSGDAGLRSARRRGARGMVVAGRTPIGCLGRPNANSDHRGRCLRTRCGRAERDDPRERDCR